jgi:tripartite-type tricarboxylate transporter receptor subunit TctC
VVNSPEMREQLALQGAEPASGTPDEFRKAIREELVANAKLVKAMDLKAE